MKALILAAGLGTRLRPYSEVTPKPLFPINGRPILDWVIQRLIAAGTEALIINTHHRNKDIEAFVAQQSYPIPVETRYEANLLGTGGAIKNVADFWDDAPFLVVNSDIFTDIDLAAVYAFHHAHSAEVTLVMHDCPEFNQVAVDANDYITAIRSVSSKSQSQPEKYLAFTGIHVLSPSILTSIPADGFVDVIDVYEALLAKGSEIKALIAQNHTWRDIGTPQSYRQTVLDQIIPVALKTAGIENAAAEYTQDKLKGDGSDRTWYRIRQGDHSIIMVDHGLREQTTTTETDAFIAIGKHLAAIDIPVPQIYHAEPFCGLVFMQDLGDTHLQSIVRGKTNVEMIAAWYRRMIDILIQMSTQGLVEFDTAWTYQSQRYDKHLIIHNECHYFVDAFLNGHLGLAVDKPELESEFNLLAEQIEALTCEGFLHRDFQSRNIMLKQGAPFLIDFQGGRIGPMQYDLAALLIDPYVDLPVNLQGELLDYCASRTFATTGFAMDTFEEGYRYCRLARNLQMLGAFGYLTLRKNKPQFEQYIPIAVRTLRQTIRAFDQGTFPRLAKVIEAIL